MSEEKTIDWREVLRGNGIDYRKIKLIHADLDGTIAIGEHFTKEEMINAKPNKRFIEFLWSVHNDTECCTQIIIYTARRTKFARETIEWLEKNNVPFAGINFRKAATDLYLDDKCLNTKHIMQAIKGKKIIH